MSEENAVKRIQEMEEILDRASRVMCDLESVLVEFKTLQPDIQRLEKY